MLVTRNPWEKGVKNSSFWTFDTSYDITADLLVITILKLFVSRDKTTKSRGHSTL